MSGLLRVPFIFVILFTARLGGSPPRAPPDAKEMERGEATGLQRVFEWLTHAGFPKFSQVFFAAVFGVETAFALATHYRPSSALARSVLATLCHNDAHLAETAQAFVSPYFVLGTGVAVSGALLRYATYRTMGRFFTFELAIVDKHKLVTRGPYAYVRHPGYTALQILAVGITLAECSSGSWWVEARVAETMVGKGLMATWGVISAYTVMILLRAPAEDSMLRKEFGKEWDAYAERVRYWYVPGLL